MDNRGSNKYYPWFDWLRLVLATLVLLSHSVAHDKWPQVGDFAVKIFFALSGWLIGGILVKLPRRELPRFYFNRALRIWCPYFIALILLVGVSLLRDHVTTKWVEIVSYKATFVYNLFGPRQLALYRSQMPLSGTGNHFWSVNAEEQFYLLAPLLLVLMPRRFSQSLVLWGTVFLIAWWTHTYASIVLGVLAAVVAYTYPELFQNRRHHVVSALAVLLLICAMAAGVDYELVSPFCALGIVLAFAVRGTRHSWGEMAGGMSYPLYLNAWIAVFFVNFFYKRVGLINPIMHELLIIAFGFALSAAMYWYIDRPLLALREKLYTATRARIVVIAAYSSVTIGICIGLLLYWQ